MNRGSGVSTVLLLGSLAACSGDTPRDVVVVTLDTLRADRLGCYGNDAGLTPSLDSFASGATLFEQAVAPAPITLTSHASLFTGRYPTRTGVRNNGTFVLPASETTLAEILRDAGWSTAAVVAAYPVHSRYGLAQGFERFDDRLPEAPPSSNVLRLFYSERNASEVTATALRTWREMSEGPRFLWVHYFDPHEPHDAPEPFASRDELGPYDREVAYLDSELGGLLKEIESSSPDAIVVVASDHGESLGEHGEHTHGIFVYQSTLWVPLLIRAPALLAAGERVATPVSLVDVVPTVLGLLGLEVPEGVDGADLRAVIGGADPGRVLYAESFLPHLEYRFSPLTMVREGDLKYIAAPVPELFDVASDPGEIRDLHGRHADEERLANKLAEFLAATDRAASRAARVELDDESAARLRSLGYVAGGSTSIDPGASLGRDPKAMIDYIAREDRAVQWITGGKAEAGLALMRELVAEVPENYVSRFRLGSMLRALGRLDESERELEAVLAVDPDFLPAVLTLAQVRGDLGKIDESIAGFRRAGDLAPEFAQPYHELGLMLESYGRFDAAAAAYLEALGREPSSPESARALLGLRDSRGDLDRGVTELREVASEHPDSVAIWTVLGEAYLRLDRRADAASAIERVLAIDPRSAEAGLLQGELDLRDGRPRPAEDRFRDVLTSTPGSLAARFGLARALLAQERLLEAEVELAKVLQIDGTFSPAHTLRGRYLEQHDDPRGAAAAYRWALSVDPTDRDAAEGLARLVAGAAGP